MLNKKSNKKFRLGLFLALIILVIVWLYWGNNTILVNQITIEDLNIPPSFTGYRIAHVSDLHNKNWDKQLIEKLGKEKPDIIVVTGDIIDSRKPNEYIALDFLIQAKEVAPIFYVSGNHEAKHIYYPKFKAEIQTLGVRVLENEFVFLEKDGSRIKLLGLDDPNFTRKTEEINSNSKILEAYLEKMEDGFEGFKILLSHRPELFSTYKNKEIDLTLSGHAHGGQIRLPLIGSLYAPGQGFFPKYDSGLYEEEGYRMIVSRGLGNSVFPIRFNNNPEIILIELVNN